jgi:hypothetical protein
MSGARDHLDQHDDRAAIGATRRSPGPETVLAIAGPADPRLAHGADAGGGLLHLQRTAGNAAVSSLLAPTVQRVLELDEMSSDVTPAADAAGGPAAATAGPAGPAAAVEGAGPVTSDGTSTTISGATINLDSAMTQTDGVIRAGTIIADSVVATNYTPGAGNVW